jgi:hypothetical protein
VRMDPKELAAIKARRAQQSAVLGSNKPKRKPKPMKKPTGKAEQQLKLSMSGPDFSVSHTSISEEHDGLRSESFFVEYMAPSLNSLYAGVHWAVRKKQADKGHQACNALPIAPFTKPVKLTFTPVVGKRARARDCSNYAYAVKVIEDGLVHAKIIKDDTNEYVKSITINEPVTDRSIESGVWVQIEEVEGLAVDQLKGEYPWRNVS